MNLRKFLFILASLLLLGPAPFGGTAQPMTTVPNAKENDRVRVLDFQFRKGAKENFHSHPAAVTYVIAPFKIRFTFPDGTMRIREAKAGEVFYCPS